MKSKSELFGQLFEFDDYIRHFLDMIQAFDDSGLPWKEKAVLKIYTRCFQKLIKACTLMTKIWDI